MTPRTSKLRIPPRLRILRQPLLTPRLELSPLAVADAESFFAAVQESRPALAPWLPWVPLNRSYEESVRYADLSERDWDANCAARFYIRLRNSSNVIGVVSLENCSPTHQSCYLGYWLHVDHWGKGLMTEATERALRFAFEEMKVHRTVCAAGTENTRSLRVIKRLGFHFEGVARDAEWIEGRWISHSVFSLLSSEWAQMTTHNGESE